MFTFFKKNTEIATEFFTLGRYILKNPTEFKNLYMLDHKPKVLGTDEAFGLAAKLLDITDEIAHNLDFPKLVHLKPMVQNWPWSAEKVTEHAGFYLNKDGNLKIGNYQQTSIVHYVEKDLITDEVISLLEEIAWNKN
jgi:hypothetical protein